MSKLQRAKWLSGNRLLSGLLTIVLTVLLTALTASTQTLTPGQTINYQGPGGTTVTGEGYTIPSPYGSLWTVVDEWGFGRINDANPSNNFDELVVDVGGIAVWRLSNAVTSAGFSDQPASPSAQRVAGESTAFLWNDRGPIHTTPTTPGPRAPATTSFFNGSFRFRSVTGAAQPGLIHYVNPIARQSDRRMVQLALSDSGTGLDVSFTEVGPNGTTFPSTTIATGLSYTDWHDIAINIQFVDGINGDGTGNDIVTVLINDVPVHVGTTWETYYLAFTPTRPVGAVDAIAFRAAGTAVPANLGNGFYFGDVVAAAPLTNYVDADGEVGPLGCADTGDAAFTTISAAITGAVPGDIINVCPGTYPENVVINKSLTVNGSGQDLVTGTIISPVGGTGVAVGASNVTLRGVRIDPQGAGAGVSVTASLTGLALDSVTATNGNVGFRAGTGIDITGLTVTDSHFDGNIGQGWYLSEDSAGNGGLVTDVLVTNTTFNNNVNKGIYAEKLDNAVFDGITVDNSGTGGPSQNHWAGIDLNLKWAAYSNIQILNSTITNSGTGDPNGGGLLIKARSTGSYSTVPATLDGVILKGLVISGNGGGTYGAGIRIGESHNTFTGIDAGPTNVVISFSTIKNNAPHGLRNATASTNVMAENNWWGCNYGPGGTGAGCSAAPNVVLGSFDFEPWLTLTSSASPDPVIMPATSAVTSTLTINSASVDTSASGNVLDGTTATFVGTGGTVSPAANTTTSGVTGTTFTPTTAGAGGVATTIDDQTVNAPITVLATCPTVSTEDTTSPTTHPSTAGIAKTIPVITTDLTGRGAISVDFTFNYDPAVLDPTPANITVTPGPVLSGSTVIVINPNTPGTLVISVYENGAGSWSGAGTLVDINMRVIGAQNSTSPLTLTDFRYNNNLVCSDTVSGTLTVISGTITGQVLYENALDPSTGPQGPGIDRPVPGVTMTAVGGTTFSSMPTDMDGFYSLSGFGSGSYTVTPARPAYVTNAFNGIFSNDATLISRHVVGLVVLNPTQIKAARVSGLAVLSSFDSALLSQYIVGITNPINQTGQWKFNPVDRTYPNVLVDMADEDYLGLLMGDVNGDWSPLGARPAPVLTDPERIRNAVKTSVASVTAQPGEAVTVPFSIENLKGEGVTSYQFDIEYDSNVLAPAEVSADLTGTVGEGLSIAFNTPEKGILKVVVYGATPVTGDGVFVNLRFMTVGAGGSSSPLTISQFRFNDGDADVVTIDGKVRVLASDREGESISGRLLSAFGKTVADTGVVLTSTTGSRVFTTADANGYFEFIGLTAGETYTVSVASKRFPFAPRTVSVTSGVTQLNMIAEQ